MKKVLKYNYYKTIQEYYGSWESVDFYASDSQGYIGGKHTRERFKENLKAYRENSSVPVRVCLTKENNPNYKGAK